mgnify:CR=1 FL=1
MALKTLTQERRHFPRSAAAARLSINLVHPHTASVSHVNYSEGGVCLRLDEALEVRSLIRFQVAAANVSPARKAWGRMRSTTGFPSRSESARSTAAAPVSRVG